MTPTQDQVIKIESITGLMQRLGAPAPAHPLIGIVNYDITAVDLSDAGNWYVLDFYKITFKQDFRGSVRYGPGRYDFKEGGMAFLAPGQPVRKSAGPEDYQGYALYFHPDLLLHHPLAQGIHQYGFFSYAVSEALFLSDTEKQTMLLLFGAIAAELDRPVDQFSEDVWVSQLELLLNYSNRFYHRQFLTRKKRHHDLSEKIHEWLEARLEQGAALAGGLPSPQELADHLNVSQRYLSDMLKALTGNTTQQYIHLALIERAKIWLNQTNMTTAEIAYRLGFEHPQSFNKLFKSKTSLSPLAFRQSLN